MRLQLEMKTKQPRAAACVRPGDRVIRVHRRPRNRILAFFASLPSLFRFGGSPGAR
jgi:hypothetical protein